jgi:hypothetical protein
MTTGIRTMTNTDYLINELKEKTKEKTIIALNSHSLSYFQHCPMDYKKTNIDLLVPRAPIYPFTRGAAISRYLAYWYRARLRLYSLSRLNRLEFRLFKRMKKDPAFIRDAKQDDRLMIASRIFGYFNKYRQETLKVVAVEEGFSRIFYEDNSHLFIYEGRPDLVVDFGSSFRTGIGFVDHKSEARSNDLLHFNNQFLGYAWGLRCNRGLVNYFGLQKDPKDGEIFRRDSIIYSDKAIERWRDDTLEWFFKLAWSLRTGRFVRSWQCSGKYGTCRYHALCSSGSENEEQLKTERDFVKLDAPYRSW